MTAKKVKPKPMTADDLDDVIKRVLASGSVAFASAAKVGAPAAEGFYKALLNFGPDMAARAIAWPDSSVRGSEARNDLYDLAKAESAVQRWASAHGKPIPTGAFRVEVNERNQMATSTAASPGKRSGGGSSSGGVGRVRHDDSTVATWVAEAVAAGHRKTGAVVKFIREQGHSASHQRIGAALEAQSKAGKVPELKAAPKPKTTTAKKPANLSPKTSDGRSASAVAVEKAAAKRAAASKASKAKKATATKKAATSKKAGAASKPLVKPMAPRKSVAKAATKKRTTKRV
jgi:hypothetical protein